MMSARSYRLVYLKGPNYGSDPTDVALTGVNATQDPATIASEFEGYRYGFNGSEKDNEIKGEGNSYNFGSRIYDSRLGKFMSIDNEYYKFPFQSPYLFASNSPIIAVDLNGDSTYVVLYGKGYLNPTMKGSQYDVGDGFKNSALARKNEILNRPGYDASRDEVIMLEVATEDEYIAALNADHPKGPIAEMHVYSHGSNNSINLGGTDAGGADRDYRSVSGWGSTTDPTNSNPDNSDELGRIDATKFEDKARITLWGCHLGDSKGGTADCHASILANKLGGNQTVSAFQRSAQFKTKEKTNNGKPIYDGELIQDIDCKTNKVNLTVYKKTP